MAKILTTPGVYMEGKSAFPNSIVPISTAVPAFIGYTGQALMNKVDIKHVPTRISSFGEYVSYFGGGPRPVYKFKKWNNAKTYELTEPTGRYLLYYSMKLFFANGGSDCYIVSIGNYGMPVNKEDMDGEEFDGNQKIVLKGIRSLTKEAEPTMVVIPDAVLLTAADCATIQRSMLEHCGFTMLNRIAILDVYDGFKKRSADPKSDVISLFRESVVDYLQWGTAYYPWVHTTITSLNAVDFKSIEEISRAGMIAAMIADVNVASAQGALDKTRAELIKAEINKISSAREDEVGTVHQTLLVVSPLYKAIMASLLELINLLPPGAGLAGIYAMVDKSKGVFQSPANISIGSVVRPAVNLTNEEQEDLNLPLSGKAINAIRTFPGKGILIWGARTLDGNSQDWRYINVRRTVIFIEQSIKYGMEPYVFEPNTYATWMNAKALIINFLTNLWQQGGLAGTTPEDAFSVSIGLGETMTPVDILDGYMSISVKLAITRPAEFIVISFIQKMQQS